MASNAAGRPPSALEMLLKDRGLQVLSLVGLLSLWALFSYLIGTFGGHSIVPGPIDVAPEFAKLIVSGNFFQPLVETLSRTGVGFLTAFIAGLTVGLATAKLPTFKLITAPSMLVLLFAPTLVLIYLGTSMIGVRGGSGYVAIALIAGLVVAPNVAIYMRDVMADFDQELADMADSYRATTRQRIFDVYIPYLVPPILAASRICFSQSWKVVMLTEVFGMPGGLGYQIRSSYYIFDLTRMMSYLVVFILALLVIEQVIRLTEHRLVKWQ
jgi:NitT/TauT family transport system permease protein